MTPASKTDLQAFRDMAERFAKNELAPKAVDLDNYPFKEINKEALEKARDTGLLSVTLPEEHGGVGQGMEVLCETLLALARADGSFAAIVFANALAQSALLAWATDEQVGKLASSLVAMPAYDLPNDLQRGMKAEKKGKGYSLSGKVEYVTLAPIAEAMILPAMVGDKVSMFLVDADNKGVSLSEPVISLGLRGCPAADVELDKVSVGADALICSDAESEFPKLVAGLRCGAAAMAVGVLEGSYQGAKDYAKERYQGGQMIVDYDMVRMMLVNMAVLAESGKELVSSMARAADQDRPWPISDAGLILLTEQAARATTDGVQCLGGYGYMEDYGQEKRMRDAKQIENIFGSAPAKRLELMADILRQEE